jgi:26S proteasome regulatory subunit N2
MYTVAMAYCGTGNNAAVHKLLHVAVSFHTKKKNFFSKKSTPTFFQVSDVNDDVRRSAVESLGFLMFR